MIETKVPDSAHSFPQILDAPLRFSIVPPLSVHETVAYCHRAFRPTARLTLFCCISSQPVLDTRWCCHCIRQILLDFIYKWKSFFYGVYSLDISLLRPRNRSGVLWWKCLSVCLFVFVCAHDHIFGTTRPIFNKFVCTFPMALARSAVGGAMISCVLPVL